MKKKKPIRIRIKSEIDVMPELVYESVVKESGKRAIIPSYKKFIGKKVTVIVRDEEYEKNQKVGRLWNEYDM